MEKFYCDGLKIRDTLGRERIFRGVNFCYKLPNVSWHNDLIEKAVRDIKKAGINLVRLGVTWAALEPERGKYNDELLDRLAKLIAFLGDEGIYVFFDMHQDLYSPYFHGDGAPKWAVDRRHKSRHYLAIWAEGYFYMQGVQGAFGDFWDNYSSVQDDFFKLWEHCCEKLSPLESCIGFDWFNEPYPHENGRKIFTSFLGGLAEGYTGKNKDFGKCFKGVHDRRDFVKMALSFYFSVLKTPSGFKRFMEYIDDRQVIAGAVNGLEEYLESFHREKYSPFYNRLSALSGDKFSLMEHSYFSNLGVPFDIPTNTHSVYSPHAYDFFVDSPLYSKYCSIERVGFIIDKIRENQLKMNVPVIFGEWGGGVHGSKGKKHIQGILNKFEEYHWSNTYWGALDNSILKALSTPYPTAVCGDILEMKTDYDNREFYLKYNCPEGFSKDIKTQIFIPEQGFCDYTPKLGENVVRVSF